MFALFLGYVLVIQRAVEQAFGRQFCFAEPLPPINVFVWIHLLLPKQVSLLFVLCVFRGVLQGFPWKIFRKCIQRSSDACRKFKL